MGIGDEELFKKNKLCMFAKVLILCRADETSNTQPKFSEEWGFAEFCQHRGFKTHTHIHKQTNLNSSRLEELPPLHLLHALFTDVSPKNCLLPRHMAWMKGGGIHDCRRKPVVRRQESTAPFYSPIRLQHCTAGDERKYNPWLFFRLV